MRPFTLFVLLGALCSGSQLHAQDHAHDQDHHHHHHKNEIGVANSPVYFVKEEEFSYGLHAHFVHFFGHSKFGAGLGYERIFDEHKHTTIGVVGSYRATDEWSVNIAPGVTFEADEEKGLFAVHVETTYEFAIGDLHLGPVLEYAYDPEDHHVSLGLHVGYGF